MKKALSLIIIISVILICIFSCTKNSPTQSENLPENPKDESDDYIQFVPHAELSLVKVGGENSLAKPTSESDIDFGEILATKKLSYIIMNTGNLDIFDIQFTANKLEIFPNSIGILDVPEGGLSTTPIVSFTVPHVIPSSGVGSLLDMEIGEITDTISLSYKYQLIPFEHAVLNTEQIVALMDSIIATSDTTTDTLWTYGDTLNVVDIEEDTIKNVTHYSVGGTKMGIIIDVDTGIDEIHLQDIIAIISEREPNVPQIQIRLLDGNEIDSLVVTNNGNCLINISTESYISGSLESLYMDTSLTILPYSSFDVGTVFQSTYSNLPDSTRTTVNHYIKFGPTKYIIYVLGGYYTAGYVEIRMPSRYNE